MSKQALFLLFAAAVILFASVGVSLLMQHNAANTPVAPFPAFATSTFKIPVAAKFATSTAHSKTGLQIGPFTKIVDTKTIGTEDNCNLKVRQSLMATVEDMIEHMAPKALAFGYTKDEWLKFEMNDATLDILCSREVLLKLTDDKGNLLYLEKPAFEHTSVPGQESAGLGILIRIEGALAHKGAAQPAKADEYGQLFLPDSVNK